MWTSLGRKWSCRLVRGFARQKLAQTTGKWVDNKRWLRSKFAANDTFGDPFRLPPPLTARFFPWFTMRNNYSRRAPRISLFYTFRIFKALVKIISLAILTNRAFGLGSNDTLTNFFLLSRKQLIIYFVITFRRYLFWVQRSSISRSRKAWVCENWKEQRKNVCK